MVLYLYLKTSKDFFHFVDRHDRLIPIYPCYYLNKALVFVQKFLLQVLSRLGNQLKWNVRVCSSEATTPGGKDNTELNIHNNRMVKWLTLHLSHREGNNSSEVSVFCNLLYMAPIDLSICTVLHCVNSQGHHGMMTHQPLDQTK